jgi:D-alanyl-D-alanine-carboxypeptidase/D-alanyl-D-alanine-endopeptidase
MLPYSRAELYQGLAQTRLEAEPGARWSYSNLGYAVLGEVVERASGRSYEVMLKESLVTPLGLKDTGVAISPEDEKRIPSGYWVGRELVARPRWQMGEVVSFAGMHSTARDLAQFLIAQTSTGTEAVLSPAVRAALHTPSRDVVVAPGRGISLGWFIESLPGGLRGIGGGGEVDSFSGTLAFFERPRIGIVVLTNRGASAGAEAVIREVMSKVLATVLAKP